MYNNNIRSIGSPVLLASGSAVDGKLDVDADLKKMIQDLKKDQKPMKLVPLNTQSEQTFAKSMSSLGAEEKPSFLSSLFSKAKDSYARSQDLRHFKQEVTLYASDVESLVEEFWSSGIGGVSQLSRQKVVFLGKRLDFLSGQIGRSKVLSDQQKERLTAQIGEAKQGLFFLENSPRYFMTSLTASGQAFVSLSRQPGSGKLGVSLKAKELYQELCSVVSQASPSLVLQFNGQINDMFEFCGADSITRRPSSSDLIRMEQAQYREGMAKYELLLTFMNVAVSETTRYDAA